MSVTQLNFNTMRSATGLSGNAHANPVSIVHESRGAKLTLDEDKGVGGLQGGATQ